MGVQVAPVAVAEATDIETGQGVPPACPFKEATLELRDSRILELRSMMHRGAEYAEAAVLRAGYFGGESRLAIAGWSFAGCLLVLYSIQLLYHALLLMCVPLSDKPEFVWRTNSATEVSSDILRAPL